jgi:hypothetical protein
LENLKQPLQNECGENLVNVIYKTSKEKKKTKKDQIG